MAAGDGHYGAATSYGGVTSGEGLPITSGSNILSPNTTPS
jgi:tetrahydromethanopterin S-methyltransferase subunit E